MRKDLDGILVVGGLGCVPSVREYMELFFGKSPLKSPRGVTPDEAVVIGAAIHGEKFRYVLFFFICIFEPLFLYFCANCVF